MPSGTIDYCNIYQGADAKQQKQMLARLFLCAYACAMMRDISSCTNAVMQPVSKPFLA